MSGKDNGRILGTNLGRNNFAIFDGNLGFGRIYIERELEVVPRLFPIIILDMSGSLPCTVGNIAKDVAPPGLFDAPTSRYRFPQ